MSNPFVAEIRIFTGNFAPKGWAECDGQLMPISQNTALFSLVGTFYGGDGKSTFALPNLQGSAPMHWGNGPGLTQRFVGESSGVEAVTLLSSEMPAHSHAMESELLSANLKVPSAGSSSLARSLGGDIYTDVTDTNLTTLSPVALGVAGGSLPHNNMQPFLTLNFIIALQGIFPARS